MTFANITAKDATVRAKIEQFNRRDGNGLTSPRAKLSVYVGRKLVFVKSWFINDNECMTVTKDVAESMQLFHEVLQQGGSGRGTFEIICPYGMNPKYTNDTNEIHCRSITGSLDEGSVQISAEMQQDMIAVAQEKKLKFIPEYNSNPIRTQRDERDFQGASFSEDSPPVS